MLWPNSVANGYPCTIVCMEKKYVTSCLSDSVLSLLHIWPLNYSCWKRGEIYSDLDRVSDWAQSPVPLPHTALEPWTHMGAIICKVAAVAPGNDLKGACVCVCACWNMQPEYVYSLLSHPHISSKWRGECAVSRRRYGEIIVLFKPQSLPPTPLSLTVDYLFKYCKALEWNVHTHIYLTCLLAVKPSHMCLL